MYSITIRFWAGGSEWDRIIGPNKAVLERRAAHEVYRARRQQGHILFAEGPVLI